MPLLGNLEACMQKYSAPNMIRYGQSNQIRSILKILSQKRPTDNFFYRIQRLNAVDRSLLGVSLRILDPLEAFEPRFNTLTIKSCQQKTSSARFSTFSHTKASQKYWDPNQNSICRSYDSYCFPFQSYMI